ncbi:hypothetical protein NUW54_g1639 [Trametes sanguinea]|uniref:Uncharacterized protein n=1 Tax=Trametes sanguinea TaxID=158606 RepID=A0ACC1Q5S5_9APHY|nr:hypothetical protein NUW54_g1639 [Trametes sanguinea]
MQAQALRTDQSQAVITSQQSLQSIQTLLRAGLGCITYLRNLLPSDNFSESYLTSSAPDSLSSQPSMSGNSFASADGRRNVSGFKIMTVTRGFTEEADRLMDYLESGIFDALQKQYLRSFVFAIYLDDQDPNNIVEAYTFNFSYCKVPGLNSAVPVMSLGEDMMNLSLSGSRSQDPVADAARRGKVPTLGEVKRSLKALIKNLIQATTQMDALPRRRFATFKLFYYENTPEDYEPPHFRAGDAQRDKWFMSTHEKGEVPERCSVGSVQTGYHAVDVKVTSVSGYLPSGEDNNAPFSGTMTGNPFGAPPLTPAGEAALRAQQLEAQRQDAFERKVVWDGDEGLLDSEPKVDAKSARPNALDNLRPIGIRDVAGNIIPLEETASPVPGKDKLEARYAGRPESVPLCIGELAKAGQQPGEEVSPTQELEETQVISSSRASAAPSRSPSRYSTPTPMPKSEVQRRQSDSHGLGSSLPPSDIEVPSSLDVDVPESIDTQMIKDIIMQGASAPQEDSMILDMETQQLPEIPGAEDPIESFPVEGKSVSVHGGDVSMERESVITPEVECECGVQVSKIAILAFAMEDAVVGIIFGAWVITPLKTTEFHRSSSASIAAFKDLAIQRRGIKVFEAHAPKGLSEFTKLIDCDSTVAGQVFKRLEAEGFIAQEIRETDGSGFLETTMRTSKRKTRPKAAIKGKAGQNRKALQKPVYVFVQAIKNDDIYKDYFNPEPEVEKRLSMKRV